MATAPLRDSHIDPLDGWSLPAWTYSDPDFHAAEMERIFRPSWQIVCHDSDIPNVGDWHSIDPCRASVIVVRGTDCNYRALPNGMGRAWFRAKGCQYCKTSGVADPS